MGGHGKHKWKMSFYHRNGSSSSPKAEVNSNPSSSSNSGKEPPKEFFCPIHGSLMADPVVIASGQSFDRISAELCRELGYYPPFEDGSKPDFSAIITNRTVKSTILAWCAEAGVPAPHEPSRVTVERLIRASIVAQESIRGPELRVSERELIDHVSDQPPVTFSHAETEIRPRGNHNHRRFYSSSSEESVVVSSENPGTPLPFATRPLSYNNYYSSSSSSEITELENLMNQNLPPASEEEDEMTRKMKSPVVTEQEEAAIALRKLTRTREDLRVSLCTQRLLLYLKPLIASRYSAVQVNAIASLVNLSLEKPNKVTIVRSGFVPLLIDVLKSGSNDAQEHAAGALFSLALEDDNKMAIGVLGALQPLMHALMSAESERTRHDSALALYHLTLVQSNRVKLVKLNAVPTLLAMSQSGTSASRVLLILCNLAVCPEGRSAMLDSNAVECLVGMLRGGKVDAAEESKRENCVAALFALSHGNMRFRGLAKDAGAVEALREVEERGSDRAREKARRILLMMRGRGEDDGEYNGSVWRPPVEFGGGSAVGDGSALSGGGGGLTENRYRAGVGRNLHSANSTTF